MSKVASVGIVLLFGTGCATQHVPLEAMLLPPVDGKLALWINQPANFAVLGVGPERGTEVLYQQTALEGVPASGYVYVPMRAAAVPAPQLVNPDADYEQVYLVASDKPIDLSAFPSARRDVDPGARPDSRSESMRYVLASSQVVDGYRYVDTVDRVVCDRDLSLADILRDADDPWHVYNVRSVHCPRHQQRSVVTVASTRSRTFFTPVPKLHPPGKGEHPRIPPGLEPKSFDRTARYLAAKDEWHALTHNGQPGTELARAGYVQTSSGWSRGQASVSYATRNSTTSYRAESSAPARAASTSSAPSSSASSSSSASAHPH